MDPIARLVCEHAGIKEWIQEVEAALEGTAKVDAEWLRACQGFLSITVLGHFASEEREAFQAFAACNHSSECSGLIGELLEEHAALRAEFASLLERTASVPRDGEVPEDVLAQIRELLSNLEKHALREEEELLPLVRDHDEAILAWLEANSI